MSIKVEVVPHDPQWRQAFEAESKQIAKALGQNLVFIHIYEINSPEIKRHFAFRDYAIAHPQEAQQYSKLKQELAQKYPNDIEGYMDGKDEFIRKMERKALQWYAMNE